MLKVGKVYNKFQFWVIQQLFIPKTKIRVFLCLCVTLRLTETGKKYRNKTRKFHF